MTIDDKFLSGKENTLETTTAQEQPAAAQNAKKDYFPYIETIIFGTMFIGYILIETLVKRKGKSYRQYTGFF